MTMREREREIEKELLVANLEGLFVSNLIPRSPY